MASVSKGNSKNNPPLTKNGKIKIKSFNISQLSELYEKTKRPRDKDKIDRRIKYLTSKKHENS